MAAQDIALRKRQQIAKANRTMFVWVTGISVVVGASLVISLFLFQKMVFNEKVLAEKQHTVSVLRNNNLVIGKLKEKVKVLNTNQALLDSRAKTEDKPLQVILDALPSDVNSSALGGSLQEVLLKSDNISIESLIVDPVTVGGVPNTASSGNVINFSFKVSVPTSQVNSLRDLLGRLERSIRAIDIQSLVVETQGAKIVLSVDATAFYEPAVNPGLKEKVIRP